ncbi:MAG: flippase-like domain-containing protein [Gemmatimonadales bacterium]|nr:MAG: flippase-like domain-containing protein [Gemmatimonadales bacterium]
MDHIRSAMATLVTPKVLRRGLEFSLLASLLGFAAVLLHNRNYEDFLASLASIEPIWLLVGVLVASLDWVGGGLRHWVISRHVWPKAPLRGMIVAGGMGAWAGYLTPVHGAAGPMMIYAMKRVGVPIPVGVSTILMSFITTVIFFAVAGPLALVLGAGRSLGQKGDILGLSLLDIFTGSLSIFGSLGVLLLFVILAPGPTRNGVHWIAEKVSHRSRRVAERLEGLRRGIDEAHSGLIAYNSPRGWLAISVGVVLTAAAYGPRLLAGYVALRAIGIEANFIDVLLLQTLITFLLYFAPTPGASGVGEILSAAVMSVYVPKELVVLYTLLWRVFVTYTTVAVGAVVFYGWLRTGLKGLEEGELVPVPPESR